MVGSCAARTPDQTRPCRDPTIVIKFESNWFFSKKKNQENQETGLVLNLKKLIMGSCIRFVHCLRMKRGR